MTESVHSFRNIHDELGIRISDLGCIMADTNTLPVTEIVDWYTAEGNSADDLYVSPRVDERPWINGAVGERSAHVTLLYGLMQPGLVWKKHVDQLLADVQLDKVVIDKVDFFESPYQDDPYYCIVAKIKLTDELKLAHSRLSYLPHINTFPDFNAHVTLAYIKKDEETRDAWVTKLNHELFGTELFIQQINYGGEFK